MHVKNRKHILQSKINEETSEDLCDTYYEKISKNNLARHLQSEGHKLKSSVIEKERRKFYNEVIGVI
jgi:hypothetical protein